ncbi:MAG: pantoate--beta-alanine ligase [Calditrichaeota bacterium]|nr:pantoate--beta-alanine ligase [Calditrichota bacterium]MCB9366360.1 pantoate--beta-alanine ligase [Calditrichota bacterium]
MKVVTSHADLKIALDPIWRCGAPIGFIPTMGALHEGHLSLMRLCGPCDVRVASIFVNPTQFGPKEDFGLYPRTLEDDLKLLEHEGLDIVYVPTVEDMYGASDGVSVRAGKLGEKWEGVIRPGHFDGVLTVVLKFFSRIRPDLAVFGEKDFQQLTLIRAMCRSLDLPIRIVAGETVREADGLAMSSRNRFLKHAARERAATLYRALRRGQSAFAEGDSSLAVVREQMKAELADDIEVDYLTVLDSESLEESDPVRPTGRLLGAVRLGSVRLIDNMPISDATLELSRA